MAIGTYGELKTAVQNWSARTDQQFFDRIPEFVQLAEHRIFYGSKEQVETGAVRVRQMEEEIELTPAASGPAMAATLPSDYLSMRRVYAMTSLTQHLIYASPQDFWTDVRVSPGEMYSTPYGWPSIYTIEAQQIFVSPFQAGTIKALYYKRYPNLAADEDTNWLLQNVPGIYFQASMAEAWGYARNDRRQQDALAKYAGLVAGLNVAEQKARRSGGVMAPQTIGTRVGDRGWWG